MTSFVDMHTHILPGLDDGPDTLDEALAMARQFVACGTTLVFATPHGFSPTYHADAQSILKRVEQLTTALADAQIPLEVHPGMEIRFQNSVFQDLIAQRALCLGNAQSETRFALIELPTREWPSEVPDVIYELGLRKIRVILAHPERNLVAHKNEILLDDAIAEGALVQLTAGSITGQFGVACERLSRQWLATGRAHLIASDAHDTHIRKPGLREAYERVQFAWKLPEAAAACQKNAIRLAERTAPSTS